MSISKRVNRLVGQAMHSYSMLSDGDRVMVGVSGGVDSLFLVWLLRYWRKKAPIHYEILAVHVDQGFDAPSTQLIEEQIKLLDVPYLVSEIRSFDHSSSIDTLNCYQCSRNRRNKLFELAETKGFSKIALGHNKDDLIETFFLNMVYSGNLSTMVPRQDLFNGSLAIIRPLAFLDKSQIQDAAKAVNISPVRNPCPWADHSRRQTVRDFLNPLFANEPKAKASIFASLSNLKPDYLLKPLKANPMKGEGKRRC